MTLKLMTGTQYFMKTLNNVYFAKAFGSVVFISFSPLKFIVCCVNSVEEFVPVP